jgi:riboflavin synthase
MTAHGTGQEERCTSGLSFSDALGQPGGEQDWMGSARVRNGRTPGAGNQAQVGRRVLIASEGCEIQHVLGFVGDCAKKGTCSRPGPIE